ncbi:Tat (twin-arginine translocation) pathway signal sequence domain-containing protein [Catenovulum agarivorans DS-2]|uniref:Tat (Twin-arginine translocation) pathway signal sequence domain-containing protein n=1 Tax=Catenovulum agarivorans DS-2 TaxID=1328313 RepID=W7R228_9ALTE|nr:DUF1552 domain-containing protein [Catenovulum agarivorans]EWH11675.1 Tat (twin-arginine translocation) pathway signal sequence domain-containing protein [Catenovulum agarivorans DS-2]
MNILKNKMQRRDFLRTMAKAGLTTAFASQFAFSSKAFAAAGDAKRFIMVFYPNGCVRDSWHNYTTGPLNANSFDASPLAPLGKHWDKMLPIKNLTLAGHGGSTGHPEACRGVFSGGQSYAPTFDTSIGESLGGQLTNNMHVGCFSSKAISTDYMPFTDKNGNKVLVPDDPQLIYDNLLADVVGQPTGDPSPETLRRRRVLESLHENLDLLQANSLNVQQQGKLMQHEEALNFYQNTLTNSLNVGNGSYSRPTIGMTDNDADAELIAQEQMRNIAMAFEANITRTATFQFMGAQDESVRINFESIRERMGEFGIEPKLYWNETRSHVSSHNESDLFTTQTFWYNLMISQLIDELAARPDNAYGGTLIDNTLILVMSEVGGGNHQMDNPGTYVAGGAGGAIRTGNAIDAGGAGMSNLFWDISNAFGLGWGNYGNSFGGINGFQI